MSEDRGLAALRAPTALARTGEIPSLRRVQRAETVGALLASVASFGIWTLAALMALGTLGLDLGPLIAGAGIVGVAIGFGSQNLVRDFISGIFMLMEDQYGVGDVVDAGPATGTVEGVGLRTTRLRDVNGTLWHIPNGEIRRVGNRSQGWARALVDVEVAYSTDLDDGHPHHRAGRPRPVRRRPVGAQDPGAARGLGRRGARPRQHPRPPGRQDPPPGAVEGRPRAPRPPQGRLRPGRHRGLGPEGPHQPAATTRTSRPPDRSGRRRRRAAAGSRASSIVGAVPVRLVGCYGSRWNHGQPGCARDGAGRW